AGAMAASALFILDLKGKPLISRNYKGDVGLGEIEHFMGVLLQREEEGTLTPLLTHGHVHFLWIKHANLYLVATTKKNGNASLVYSFLYKVVEVSLGVWGRVWRGSVSLIWGSPLPWVMVPPRPGVLDEGGVEDSDKDGDGLGMKVVMSTEGDDEVSARAGDEDRGEDGDEDRAVPCPQVSANGSVVLSEVMGTIKLKVFLSGMPELRLGLNDRVLFELTGRGKNKSVELEDVKFHQCVRLSRFDNDRTISFIPPDGDFELMSYRLHTQVKPLIWIESIIEKFSHSRVEIMVKAKGQFKKQSVANGVEIAVPVPSDADSPKFKTTVGSARYLPERNLVIWSIKSFP
ncbi:AP1M2 protein, partial [Sclerurus mexicanus]|nr:AP1M2 protein [Sclerurus mexicanus]